jgi:two-component system, cell cycle sensor histidine kinase and response regulator CckA
MKPPSTVLAVDDEPKALMLLRNVIEPEGHRVLTAPDGLTALRLAGQERPDAILLDVMMPDTDGFEVCRQLRATPELATIPVILLTALDDRESRLQGLAAGADDFLTKPFDAVELRIRLRTIFRLNRYRRLYEESSRYEAAIQHSEEGIVLAELDGTIILRNAAFTGLVDPAHSNRLNFFEYFATTDAARLHPENSRDHILRAIEVPLQFGRANPTTVEISAGLVPWEGRTLAQFHVRDLTEKKALEAQLLRSQRIELLGQLSGSVVHDMNNILAAIGGSAGLIELDPNGQNTERHLTNIRTAVQRGASMLRQLLHFARGSDGPLESLHPAELAGEVASLIRESFGGLYTVSFETEPDLPTIAANATQIHQVLMNLCVNARDAMPDGGDLAIHVSRRRVAAEQLPALGSDARPGDFIVVTVRDTGTGIPPHVRDRLFDPFFTTKPKGKGTGLGLATVLRLVRRHGGFVAVETEVGRGTAFRCHFPIGDASA